MVFVMVFPKVSVFLRAVYNEGRGKANGRGDFRKFLGKCGENPDIFRCPAGAASDRPGVRLFTYTLNYKKIGERHKIEIS